MAIILDETALPPEDKLATIISKLRIAKQKYTIASSVPAIVLLELSTSTVDLIASLSKYGGDVDLINHANVKASTNIAYPANYDVQVDFAAIMAALFAIKAAIAVMNFSGAVSINADGKHEWVNVATSSLDSAIASFNAVVV